MDATELRVRARQEADDLGPEPLDPHERDPWSEEKRGAVVLLASLANYDPALLRRAAFSIADELSDREMRNLLLSAAADAPWMPR